MKIEINNNQIGGYFGFDLDDFGQFPYPQAITYNSARSAFFDLIQQSKIQKIWIPKYICNSMLEPLRILKVEVIFYDLNTDFSPCIPRKLKEDEYLLYVNYFGICSSIQIDILTIYPKERVIFDHSQAFYVAPLDCLATIYSPRKFLPVAEGGLLITNITNVPQYSNHNNIGDNIKQYEHIFIRCLSDANKGYSTFTLNESKFDKCNPIDMSNITKLLLNNFNYQKMQELRLENFRYLHSHLKHLNQLSLDLQHIKSPLTYPLMIGVNLSKQLSSRNIYIPTYWVDSLTRIEINSFEAKLVNNVTHLVCDQRYSQQQMDTQISILKEIYEY